MSNPETPATTLGSRTLIGLFKKATNESEEEFAQRVVAEFQKKGVLKKEEPPPQSPLPTTQNSQ